MADTSPTAWRYRDATYCPPCLTEALVILNVAAPAALDMAPAEVAHQVTEANALSDAERPHPLTPADTEPAQRCDACDDALPARPAPAVRRVTAWLNEGPTGLSFFLGYQRGDPMRRAYDYEVTVNPDAPGADADEGGLVAPGHPDATPDDVAEHAFHMLNGAGTSEWEAGHARRYYDAGNRSLSKGDIVVIDGTPLAVAAMGFRPAPHPETPTTPGPDRPIVVMSPDVAARIAAATRGAHHPHGTPTHDD